MLHCILEFTMTVSVLAMCTKKVTCEVIDMLISLIVVIMSQGIFISNLASSFGEEQREMACFQGMPSSLMFTGR